MERLFQILAVIPAGLAAYFLWQKNGDGAFISAVVGAVCFFISIRFQVKDRMKEREAENERHGNDENFNSPDALNDVSASEQINEQRTTDREQSKTL